MNVSSVCVDVCSVCVMDMRYVCIICVCVYSVCGMGMRCVCVCKCVCGTCGMVWM